MRLSMFTAPSTLLAPPTRLESDPHASLQREGAKIPRKKGSPWFEDWVNSNKSIPKALKLEDTEAPQAYIPEPPRHKQIIRKFSEQKSNQIQAALDAVNDQINRLCTEYDQSFISLRREGNAEAIALFEQLEQLKKSHL